ncbi:flavin-containing monooxygenase [Mycobacterium sp. WMMD1722]|uniref:flavin-containing monooxygenase n=1 Tax=Mycobacterium sp. WMMD1722 TaxID=3404117 RepID=UPI003BF46443
MTEPDHEVAIIGAGPGGIAAAHLLRERGITDLVIIERGGDFGGTWRDNHYPGLAVDIPTLWYQLSFAVNPDWSRLFAPGPEIHAYLRDTAERLGLYRHLRPHCEVTRQQWDDDAGFWRLSFKDGASVTARFPISSVGGYVNAKPRVDIPGIDDFEGTVLRPNAWDDDYDPSGKRVAVIGTGSSGVQIAAALSGVAAELEIYQRTPAWVLPKIDFDIPAAMRRILRVPGVVAAVNVAGRTAMDAFMIAPIVHLLSRLPDRVLVRVMPLYDAYCRALYRLLLRVVVRDPATRRALVPRYGILAKRPVISSAFLPALNDPHTHLVTTPIERITAAGVRTVDGVEHPADLLVTATGYELWTDPETYRTGTVLGTAAFDLAEFYREQGLSAYAGTSHPRLPNRWEIVGPLGFVGFAWPDFVETMAAHAVRVIDESRRRGRPVVTVSRDAFDRWNRRMRRAGRVAHPITGARRFARRSPLSDYVFASRPATVAPIPEERSA